MSCSSVYVHAVHAAKKSAALLSAKRLINVLFSILFLL